MPKFFFRTTAPLLFSAMAILGSTKAGRAAGNSEPSQPEASSSEIPWLVPREQVDAWLAKANRDFSPVLPNPEGRTWVVSGKGHDSAEGTEAKPLATIPGALEKAQAGDRILVKAGTYKETIRFPRSGTADKPIILEGERGPGGEWLSTIDASSPLTDWKPAPEIGEGVFQHATQGIDPYCLTANGKQILRIHDRLMGLPRSSTDTVPIHYGKSLHQDGISGFRFLILPADGRIGVFNKPGESISFWDGIEAAYGVHEGVAYLRFRNGENPNSMGIRSAPAGTALTIENQSHIVVRNLAFRGAEYSIVITGAKATHNTIEGNSVHHGRDRITLTQQTSHNLIRNNEVTLAFYGSENFGINGGEDEEGTAGEDKKTPDPLNEVRANLYRAFKHIQGTDASADVGIRLQTPGTGNRVIGNHVFSGLKGLHFMGASDLEVSGNVVHNMSSLCLVTLPGLKNAQIHDNLFFDSNIILRIHQYNTPAQRSEFHYRNIYRLPENGGKFIYVHYNDAGHKFGPEDEPEIAIYHNTMIGGERGLVCGSMRRGIGMTKTKVLNNIISTANEAVSYLFANPNRPVRKDFDGRIYQVFDYNWVGGTRRTPEGMPSWFGHHNINAAGQQLWPATFQGPLTPPEAVQGKGIDVSHPFTIADKTYPPLPGMKPGYFSGSAPDLGAEQH